MYKLRDWIDINKLDWEYLSKNPNAIHLLEQNQNKINWFELSNNHCALSLLEKNKDKINWFFVSGNPSAIYLLKNKKKNSNIYIEKLAFFPSALLFLEEYLNLIKRFWLLSNSTYKTSLLEKNINIIRWDFLSRNPGAISILEKNVYKINWENTSRLKYYNLL
jgi:hypothetical protein